MTNWELLYKDSIRTHEQLRLFLKQNYPSYVKHLNQSEISYKVFLPRHFAHHIAKTGPESALWKQFIPSEQEINHTGMNDPIGDEAKSPVPKLIHRYHNRVLLTANTHCPIDCRYCFRKNELSQPDGFLRGDIQAALSYIQEHPEINEVILTGGDPLVLTNQHLSKIINELKNINHIHYLRFHTRTPIIIPERIDDGLCEVVELATQSFTRVNFVLHINHHEEITPQLKSAINKLQSIHPLHLLSQSVLLRSVNDSVESLIQLFQDLVNIGVTPYYLHHPDMVKGGMHFYLPIEEGRRLYRQLQSQLPGWAIPKYIVDIPGGHGKVTADSGENYSFSGQLMDSLQQAHPYPDN